MERDGRTTEAVGPDDLSWAEAALTATSTSVGALPTGTVTFLLTDVEGSTRHWERDPEAMAKAMARHHELLDAAVTAHGGARPVEQGEGDSIVAAFSRPSAALLAALDAQRALTVEAWPLAEPLTVRMAVHTGEAQVRDDGSYAGPAIIRTARLRSIGHGGQVLVSSAARDLVVDELGDGVELVDLGTHRLKDLSRPERVWQLAHDAIASDFPPLRSLDAVPNNLPVSLSTFVGRFDAIDRVTRLVLDNRLVTLTGAGGSGKTRLAQQVAAELSEAYPDGVWWIDLGAVTDPALVPSAVSRAALLPEDRADRVGGIVRRLAAQRALLVFDCCEHLLDATGGIAEAALAGCPQLSILTTSRAPLNMAGELSWRMPPLDTPAQGGTPLHEVAAYDAVRLFCDRATRARQDFRLTEENAGAVVAICDRLDGIPLSIELAAARCRVLAPQQILEGLDDALRLLGGGPRGGVARHQTIDASIRWSHSLLSDAEQVLLRRLAVFAGPWTLAAATEVATDEHLRPGEVLGLLEVLVDQSLVHMDEAGPEARFRMLDTVRQFARRELELAGEAEAAAARHAWYFAARARGLWPFFDDGMYELLDRADADYQDLTAMLAHLEVHATPEEHAEVAMACLPAMSVRHMAEAARLGERVVARVDERSVLGGQLHIQLAVVDPMDPTHVGKGIEAAEATGDPDLRTRAAYWGAWSAAAAMPTTDALARLEAARRGLVEIDENHFSRAAWMAVGIDRGVGRMDDAEHLWQTACDITLCKRCNVMVWAEGALLALARGDLPAARDALARAQRFAVEVRDAAFLAYVRYVETELAVQAGEPWPEAGIEADLASALPTNHPMAIGFLLEARGTGRCADGDPEEADADLAEAIPLTDDGWPKRMEARLRRIALHHGIGDRAGAQALLDELRAAADAWEAGPWVRTRLQRCAALLALDDDPAAADDLAHEALALAAEGPWPPAVIDALEVLAAVAVAKESLVEAARLHGAAAELRERAGYRARLEPPASRFAAALTTAAGVLGAEAFDAAVVEGRALALPDAVAYAQRARGERRRPTHGWEALTPTERQVADLAVEGLSNAQIAERLFVGRETVKTHLSSVYSKVGVANRTQLVAEAARRGQT